LVQPVLDKHCGKCHQGEGKGREKLDLTLRPGDGVFKEPYLTLVGGAQIEANTTGLKCEGISGAMMVENAPDGPSVYATFPPMEYLSYTSKLIEIATSGEHNDVKITGQELRQLIGWVDANCPFRGDEEIRQVPDPDPGNIRRAGPSSYSGLPILPRTKTAPRIDRFNIPQD
jgi:hypothetical protein